MVASFNIPSQRQEPAHLLPGPGRDKGNQPDGVIPQVVWGWRSLPGTGKGYLPACRQAGKTFAGGYLVPTPFFCQRLRGYLMFYYFIRN